MMGKSLDGLTDKELDVIHKCLDATVNGSFFPEWEFSILFGLNENEVAAVLSGWPNVSFNDDIVYTSVVNSLNHLLGYPHRKEDELANKYGLCFKDIDSVLMSLTGKEEYHQRIK